MYIEEECPDTSQFENQAAGAEQACPPPRNLSRPAHPEDRFIPLRRTTQADSSHYLLNIKEQLEKPSNSYCEMLAQELLLDCSEAERIMQFRQTGPKARRQPAPARRACNISKAPIKVLDAPDLMNDYYLNILDWSNRDVLSILLGSKVYQYTPAAITDLDEWNDAYLCSVASNSQVPVLAVGGSNGVVKLYDQSRAALIREFKANSSRVSSLAWSNNTLFSGGKDSMIYSFDLRAPNPLNFRMQGHQGEICGLKADENNLASGSNDNKLILWDTRSQGFRLVINAHKAAVKALAFCPWQRNLLASGGGSKDMMIKFWNVGTGQMVSQINSDSQVCALVWNKQEKCLMSSHGYSKNQICLWDVTPSPVCLPKQNSRTRRPLRQSPPPRDKPRRHSRLLGQCRLDPALLEAERERSRHPPEGQPVVPVCARPPLNQLPQSCNIYLIQKINYKIFYFPAALIKLGLPSLFGSHSKVSKEAKPDGFNLDFLSLGLNVEGAQMLFRDVREQHPGLSCLPWFEPFPYLVLVRGRCFIANHFFRNSIFESFILSNSSSRCSDTRAIWLRCRNRCYSARLAFSLASRLTRAGVPREAGQPSQQRTGRGGRAQPE